MRIIITGAAGGIGSATVALLRARGAQVVGLDLAGSDLACDVTDQASIDAADGGWEPLAPSAEAFRGLSAPREMTTAEIADALFISCTNLLTLDGAKTQGVYRKPSMALAISKNSKDPKAAAQIINCLLAEPEGIIVMGDARGVPANAAAASASPPCAPAAAWPRP